MSFPDIEWQALRDVYGWSALQWQAWARGEIIVRSKTTHVLTLSTRQVLEIWLDGVHYFGGDYFSYERALITLRLRPGVHRLDVRLVRDVRSMGGVGEPHVVVDLNLSARKGGLLSHGHVVISDYVHFGDASSAILASPHGSVVMRNDALEPLVVSGIKATHNACVAELDGEVRLVFGQTRPVAFRVKCLGPSAGFYRMDFDFEYHFEAEQERRVLRCVADPQVHSIYDPHKVTFLHPGGVVSYAILRPPSRNASNVVQGTQALPIVLGLHGAGLEAGSDLVRHALDPVADLGAWVLFPTGGTPWSGDDWHSWGFADVEAAIAMIPDWIERVEWQGPGADVDRWLVVGHSNGGQGAWYALTHHPDKVFAAAPLSGYSSIPNYVPYHFWHPADPGRVAVIHGAMNSYRHELLLANARGIPLLLQHGSADDNVPAYHSRLMNQITVESEVEGKYYEYPDKPHYWDGVMTTAPLRQFYEQHLDTRHADNTSITSDLQSFRLVTGNPGDTGSKHGLQIVELVTPGWLGSIDVVYDSTSSKCSLRLTNVRTLLLPRTFSDCKILTLNGQDISLVPTSERNSPWTLTHDSGTWHIEANDTDHHHASLPRRRGRQAGAMDAILRTQGPFQIVTHTRSAAAEHIALQISRNLCQYFAADTDITSYPAALSAPGNIISIAVGDDLPPGFHPGHPMQIRNGGVFVGQATQYHETDGRGLAAVFLRPLPSGRLELVVWGRDEECLAWAARMVPIRSGSGQPDFLVVDRAMLWEGVQGVRALGFFGGGWEVAGSSYLP